MNERNPYAPPQAEVAEVAPSGETAPPLWNPNAAASWSLLFTPIFGAVLHMKNWQAMGEPEKAASARAWVIGSIAFFALYNLAALFLPRMTGLDALGRSAAIGLLIAWYYGSAKPQQKYVIARFGEGYPRRGWAKPLLVAMLAIVGYIVLVAILAAAVAVLMRR